jgi:nucleobase:cation symporter-1, NCS1 family
VLSAVDSAVLWADLGIGLLVVVTGALLVPALGFVEAFITIVLGSLIGVALLSLGSAAGAAHGLTTMMLLRPVLGIRGSWLPSALNAIQLIGWTAVELWAISLVADLVAQRIWGFSARLLWLAVAAVVCTSLALWGPVGVARMWMKRFGLWVVTGICLAATGLTITSGALAEAASVHGRGGWPTAGAGIDLVIAMPISWWPLVADYSRFVRSPRAAFIGTFGGYLVANVWLYLLGVVLVLGANATPDPAGIAAALVSLGGGSFAGLAFLAGLLAGETDEAFADIYSGSVSLQNIFPKASHRLLTVIIAIFATGLSAWLTMARYEAFLFLLGSVFVPLFGILAADHYVARGGQIHMTSLFRSDGRYWFTKGFRVGAVVPWVAGFLTYHWVLPTGPEWWLHVVDAVSRTPLNNRWPWLPASIASFLVAFVLTGLSCAAKRRGEA